MKKRMNKIIGLITKKKRKVVLLTIIFLMIFTSVFIYINLTNPTKINSYVASVINKGAPANKAFEDEVFYKAVIDAYNKENNTSLPYTANLTEEQLSTITRVSYSGSGKPSDEKIISTKGLEKLTNLTYLNLEYNNISEIDVSKNTALTYLNLGINNNISEIDVSKNTALTSLNLRDNHISKIDVSKNTALTSLDLSRNFLNFRNSFSIDLSSNTALTSLDLGDNRISKIDVSKNTALTFLNLGYNYNLSEIDVSKNTALTYLSLSHNNISEIDVSKNTALTFLYLGDNNISEIDVSKNIALTSLDLGYNYNLSEIDVSKNTALTSLNLEYNNISEIDVSKNTALTSLNLRYNNISEIDVSKNTALTFLGLTDNNISEIDVSKNTALTYLDLTDNNISEIDVSKNTALIFLYLNNNNLSSIDLSSNTALTILVLYDNPLSLGEYRLIKGTSVEGNGVGNVKLPEQFPITYEMEDGSIASYDDGTIKGLKSGTTYLKATLKGIKSSSLNNSEDLVVEGTIKVFDIKSDKYEINKEDKYIYTKTDADNSTIMKNITVENGTGKIENNIFKVMDEDVVVEEYKIVNYSSSTYDLSKEYIYVGTNSFSAGNIKLVNLTTMVNNNTLEIKYGNTVMESYKIVSVSSSKYDLSKDYIYTGINSLDKSKITCKNCELEEKNNNLNIKYNNEVLDSYKLLSYSSSVYDLSKEYIYVGTNSFSAGNIKLVNLTTMVNNNTLEIKYGNTVMESYKIVSVSSSKYDLSKDYIRIEKDETFDLDNIKVINGAKEYSNGKLYIKYGNEVIKTYTVSSRLKGDVNNDNKITVIDVSMLYRHVKKREEITDKDTLLISDINGDGKITVMDVSLIYRYVKGKINEL